MTVRVADFHFAGPRKVLGRLEDGRTALAVLVVEGFDVLNAKPDPGSWLTLVTSGQVNARPVSRHAGEVVATPWGVAEAKYPSTCTFRLRAMLATLKIGLACSNLVRGAFASGIVISRKSGTRS